TASHSLLDAMTNGGGRRLVLALERRPLLHAVPSDRRVADRSVALPQRTRIAGAAIGGALGLAALPAAGARR
ncbi:hypothetical protein TI06_23925, partial [Vibrio vulnificus]